MGRPRKPILLGYCAKCGQNVETDFCDKCQQYVQPSPHQRRPPVPKNSVSARLKALEEAIRPRPVPSLHEHYVELRIEWADELAAIRAECEAVAKYLKGPVAPSAKNKPPPVSQEAQMPEPEKRAPLLPCPFGYGGDAEYSSDGDIWMRHYGIGRCPAAGDHYAELWNTRATPPMPAALRRIVAEMREYEKAPRNSGIERTGANQIFGRLASAIERAFTPSEKGGTDGPV